MGNINDTLYNWALTSSLFKKACFSDSNSLSLLKQAFGDNEEKRYTASLALYEQIWDRYPEFGPRPLLRLLSEFEYDHVFYLRYRDHSTHILKTFILGLYIYESNVTIKSAFAEYKFYDGNILDEEKFLKTWTVVSLWHDIGYLFENEEIDKHNDYWGMFLKKINPQYMYPLSSIYNSLECFEEKSFMQNNSITCYPIETITSIENDDYLFNLLISCGKYSGLVCQNGNNSIKCYYNYARGHRSVDERPCYADHGIVSALLLLKMWLHFRDHINCIAQNDLNFFQKDVKLFIETVQSKIDSTNTFIIEAANAIALHNIKKEVWIKEELFDCGVNINRFRIMLDNKLIPDYYAQPFAFLLRLSDELQMWDRNRFVVPSKNDNTLHGNDMDIFVCDDKIRIWFKRDEEFTDPANINGLFANLKKRLSYCMDIESILEPVQSLSMCKMEMPLSQDKVDEAKKRYFQYLEYECGEIRLDGLPSDDQVGSKTLRLEKLYIPLKFRERSQREGEMTLTTDGLPYLPNDNYTKQIIPEGNDTFCRILLAGPGSGKTTLLKRIAIAYSFSNRFSDVNDNLPCRVFFPIWIKCRTFKQNTNISISEIISYISQDAEFKPNEYEISRAFQYLCYSSIDDGTALLLIDGLDEITNTDVRNRFIEQLLIFIKGNPKVNVLLTSRIVGFDRISHGLFSNFKQFEIAEFDPDDIITLCIEWHKVVFDDRKQTVDQASELALTIIKNPQIFALARNPLLLTALLLVNRRVGRLPTKRIALYKESIRVLLETWNQAGHAPLDLDVTICQLAYVAFDMMKRGVQTIGKRDLLRLFSAARQEQDWIVAYDNEPLNLFIERVELRSSLLIKRGYCQSSDNREFEDEYEFRHLTFQEYLAAVAIVEGYYADVNRFIEFTDVMSLFILDENKHEVILLATTLSKKKANRVVDEIIRQLDKLDMLIDEKIIISLKILLLNIVLDEAMLTQETRAKIYQSVFSNGVSNEQIESLQKMLKSKYSDEFGNFFEKTQSILYAATKFMESNDNAIDIVVDEIQKNVNNIDILVYNISMLEHILWLHSPYAWRNYLLNGLYGSCSICDLLITLYNNNNDIVAKSAIRALNELLILSTEQSYSPELSSELVYRSLLLMHRSQDIDGVEIFCRAFVNKGTCDLYKRYSVDMTTKEFFCTKYLESRERIEKIGLFWACVYAKAWNEVQIKQELNFLLQQNLLSMNRLDEEEDKLLLLGSIHNKSYPNKELTENIDDQLSNGYFYYEKGDMEKACQEFVKAWSEDYNDTTARNNLAYMLRRHEVREVVFGDRSYTVEELLEPGLLVSESFSLVNMALYLILSQKPADWSRADAYFSKVSKSQGYFIRNWWESNVLFNDVEGDIVMLLLCRHRLTSQITKWDVNNWFNNAIVAFPDIPLWTKNEVEKKEVEEGELLNIIFNAQKGSFPDV